MDKNPERHALMYAILFNSQNIHEGTIFFIDKETEKHCEIMKFIKFMSLVNGKLDFNVGHLTPPI